MFNFFNLFGIGSSFFSSRTVFLKIPASGLTLVSHSGFPKSRVSQSLCMAVALLIFCRSWAASVSVFSMRSPPAHIWMYCMQLGVREKKNVCKSTSPGNPILGPCSTSSLNLFHAWSIPSSSPYLKLITCILICWILLIGKHLAQNFFINWSQFPSTSKDANEYHFIASSSSE
jgi:hypothetical protein